MQPITNLHESGQGRIDSRTARGVTRHGTEDIGQHGIGGVSEFLGYLTLGGKICLWWFCSYLQYNR